MKIWASPFDWYHLTTLTPFKLRYHYCETTNFKELISNSNIKLADDIVVTTTVKPYTGVQVQGLC